MIEVRELTKRFPLPGGEELLAVDHVSFEVSQGEVYGLLGSNGAGKTTTLRMILGLLEPSEGWASIAGFRSNETPDEVKRRVGLVAAGAGVYQQLSVREMLLFFADLYGVDEEEGREELGRLGRLFGFQSLLDRSCATLSTGQKQRVNLARALIHRPPVVLLDEPTVGLDVIASQVVDEFIRHLRDEKKAVILSTHHLDEAERLCNRFGILHQGRIVSEGTLEELQRQTGLRTLIEMFLRIAEIGPVLAVRSEAAVAE